MLITILLQLIYAWLRLQVNEHCTEKSDLYWVAKFVIGLLLAMY